MEELTQRIQGLACDLRPCKPLGEEGDFTKGVSPFTTNRRYTYSSGCNQSGFYLYQSASGRNGSVEKKEYSPSEKREADGIPNFIWSPHLIGME